MAQVKNSSGDVKVIKIGGNKDDGTVKWFSPGMANNERFMREQGYEIAEAPELYLPEYKHDEKYVYPVEGVYETKNGSSKLDSGDIINVNTKQIEVAESAPAKRGRKPNKK